jgi:hypothetical protein
MVLSRRFGLGVAAPSLWCVSLILLRYAYPIYFDGAGPMPSFFYWRHLPEWPRTTRISSSTSYVSRLRTGLRPLSSYPFVYLLLPLAYRLIRRHSVGAYTATSLTLLFAVAAASDVVNVMWLKAGASTEHNALLSQAYRGENATGISALTFCID